MNRSRRYTFTLNNYTDKSEADLKDLYESERATYIIYGKEVAPSTGTPHLQGYIHLRNPMSMSSLQKKIPGIHLEISKGTVKQNKEYAEKDGNVTTFGEPPNQGARSDISDIKAMIKEGKRIDEVVYEANSYQAMRAAETLFKYAKPPERKVPEVIWYWGPTGIGKTRLAIEKAGADYWISNKDLKWWDGYTGQKVIILDDFRGDYCTLHYLLRLLDRYPVRVETKGSSLWLAAEKIIITSDRPPEQCYGAEQGRIDQLLRRITRTIKLEEPDWPCEDIFA